MTAASTAPPPALAQRGGLGRGRGRRGGSFSARGRGGSRGAHSSGRDGNGPAAGSAGSTGSSHLAEGATDNSVPEAEQASSAPQEQEEQFHEENPLGETVESVEPEPLTGAHYTLGEGSGILDVGTVNFMSSAAPVSAELELQQRALMQFMLQFQQQQQSQQLPMGLFGGPLGWAQQHKQQQ